MRGQVNSQGSMFSCFSRLRGRLVKRDLACRFLEAWASEARKRVEEIFGWMKAWGDLRRTMSHGLARVQLHAYILGAPCNLLRTSRLQPATR